MAWKRGTQNNSAGEIRKGHIREFLLPSSKSIGVVGKLKILSFEDYKIETKTEKYQESYFCLICSIENELPIQFHPFISNNNTLLLHSHEHPRCILTAIINSNIPPGCILLNEIQRVNSKVCIGENEDWTVYQGETFVYDGREGVIGNTELRRVEQPIPILKHISMTIRPRYIDSYSNSSNLRINGRLFTQHLQKLLYGAILSTDELYLSTPPESCLVFESLEESTASSTNPSLKHPIVCQVGELEAMNEEDIEVNEEEDFSFPDCYRGIVDVDTVSYPYYYYYYYYSFLDLFSDHFILLFFSFLLNSLGNLSDS